MAEPKKKEAHVSTAGEQTVVIKLLGNENATADKPKREDGVEVIELQGGDKVTWKNTQHVDCTVKFTKGGCPFNHGHEECEFPIAAAGVRSGDVVRGSKKRQVFEFSVKFVKPTLHDILGTPQIIVQG